MSFNTWPITLLAALTVLLTSCVSPSLRQEKLHGTATRVVDGDTLIFQNAQHEKLRVRLTGIDAPERDQAFGPESTQALRQLVEGKQVKLVSHGTDRYQRVLADVYLSKVHINSWMVENGWAWHYKQYSDDKKLDHSQQRARHHKRGLFSDPSPTPPWQHRRAKRSSS